MTSKSSLLASVEAQAVKSVPCKLQSLQYMKVCIVTDCLRAFPILLEGVVLNKSFELHGNSMAS